MYAALTAKEFPRNSGQWALRGQRYFPGIDGLRGVAAFLVVFDHMGIQSSGSLGVLAFFVLSGFLITTLLISEEREHGRVSLRAFYARRSLRIFPAFYAYWVALLVFLLLFHKRVVIAQTLCSFFYTNNYYQAIFGDPETGLSHTWSLAIEEQFYLLWPFLFLALKNNASRLRFLASAIATLWIYREIMVFVVHVHQGYVYEALDMRADHLLIGCLLAVVLQAPAHGRLQCLVSGRTWLPIVTVGILFGEQVLAQSGIPRYRDWAGFVVEPVLVALLIPQLISTRVGLTRILEVRWMRYLGRISYSIYLYQQPVIYPVKKVLRGRPVVAALTCVIVIVACASASYFLIERPFLRLKARFGPGSSRRVEALKSDGGELRASLPAGA